MAKKYRLNRTLFLIVAWCVYLLIAFGSLPKILADDEAAAPSEEGDAEEEGPVDFGNLMSCSNDLKGSVKVLNTHSVEFEISSYDGKGRNAWFIGTTYAAENINGEDDYHAFSVENADCAGSKLIPDKKIAKQAYFVLESPLPMTEYKSVGIFDFDQCKNFGHVLLNKDLLGSLPEGKAGNGCPTKSKCSKDIGYPFERCVAGKGAGGRSKRANDTGTDDVDDMEGSAPFVVPSTLCTVGLLIITGFGMHLLKF